MPILALAIAASLGGGAQQPPVAVQIHGEASDFRGALIQRFLESGRVLASAPTPDASTLSLQMLRHSVLVEARSGDKTVRVEVDRVEDDLLRLEVVHRANEAVREVERLSGLQPSVGRPRAAVPFVAFEPTPRQYAEAADPLLAAGFDVVGKRSQADWHVCISPSQSGFVARRVSQPPCPDDISDGTPPGDATPTTMVRAVESQAQAQSADDATALVDEILRDIPAAPPSTSPSAAFPGESKPAPRPGRAWWVDLRADGGVQTRLRDLDPAVGVGIGAGRGRWGASMRADVVPYVLRSDRLQIVETFLSAGPSVAATVGDRVRLRAGPMVGIHIHQSRWDGQSLSPRADLQGSVAAAVDIRLSRGLGVHVLATVGGSTRPRSHRLDGDVLWRRSAFRVGVSAGLHWRFGPQGARQ